MSALAGLFGLITSIGIGVDFAAAHPGDEKTDAEHAKQDLADTSIEQIEKETKANAAKIKKATGDTPGRQTDEQTVPNARLSAVAAQDFSQGGRWSSVVSTSVVPIFQAVLPNGKVLIWDSVGDGPPGSYSTHSSTRAMVWNPTNNTSARKDVAGYNIFCAGYIQLANGNVLVAGGNKNAAMDGIIQTHIFNWQSETWSRGPDMAAARWYPSVQALGNNEAAIVGGGPAVPEVYQTDGKLRRLTNASGYSDRLYPFLTTRENGKVELLGPPSRMNTIDTSGTGAIIATKERDGINRDYGSFATYDIGKVLVAGGGDITEGQSHVPTKTAKIVDVSENVTTVTSAASMSVGRRQHNLTVLADGSVLATGGQSRSVDPITDLDNPVFAAERWVPSTDASGPGTWTVLSSASRVRQYHSSATLLPDGRVLTGGGGVCASCKTKGYLERNIEYFEPPYLFKKDSNELATRPVISDIPTTAEYDQEFDIKSPQAGAIAKVGLVRLGAPTHSQDQGQRYVPLKFDPPTGTTITATAPKTSNIAPAGYYMLFITDSAGVPSVAKMIKLQQKPPKKGASSDFNGDGSSDAVVSDPYADPGGVADAGQMTVRYGTSSTHRRRLDVDTLVQGSGSVGNNPHRRETDSGQLRRLPILITMALHGPARRNHRTRTSSGQADSGLAQVIWGSSAGSARAEASTRADPGTPLGGLPPQVINWVTRWTQSNELSADLPMVAVGVPGGNVSGQNDAGWTGFFAAGLNDPRAVDQDSAGIPGAAEVGDRFGEAITLGLMAGTSSRVDAAVGTPGEDLGSGTSADHQRRRVHHHQRSLHRSRGWASVRPEQYKRPRHRGEQ